MRIKQLTKEVYDLIAAGEVVLGPVSVVKELVENSLDAGATRIIVEIAEGGITRIRVSDNGSGIMPEDIELAFAPHATSKLSSAEDLTHIETLGFRGEALASIAAVSSVTMVTRAVGAGSGIRAESKGGSPLRFEPAGADAGTDVAVEQLFFNIPARKKSLGDVRSEGRKVIEYISKASVCREDVAFRMISDGALVFSTLGNGDRFASIAAVYGSKAAENLVPLSAAGPDMRLEGYISGVTGLRRNRKGQHFFVNERPVTNSAVESAVSRAYREFAEPGRFPVVFLFLHVDPDTVDVNVHPAKSEVSFFEPENVERFVSETILAVLLSGKTIPKLKKYNTGTSDSAFKLSSLEYNSSAGDSFQTTSGGTGEKVDLVDINDLLSMGKSSTNSSNIHYGKVFQHVDVVDHKILQSPIQKSQNPAGTGLGFSDNTDLHYEKTLKIQDLSVIASVFATYIIATDGVTVFFIDQHAAHERINFERFREDFFKGEAALQVLLTPYMFTPPATLNDLSKYLDFYQKLGYEIDEFGENTWAARTFPAFISHEEGEAFLLESLEAIDSEGGFDPAELNQAALERIMMRACKASVKANRELSAKETDALLKALAKCDNPYTCPHGRPVFVKMTKDDIERLFKRA